MARQLSFDLPVTVSLGADDFFVSPSNAEAFAMVTGGHVWPAGKLALVGPPGSGKSHLARVWQDQTGARLLQARDLGAGPDLPPPGTDLIIEDMEDLPRAAEEHLFHLHNHLAASDGRLLLTASLPPSRWSVELPDLASRMQATALIRLGDPDDQLLAAVLTKLFVDRQLLPAPDVIPYLVARIERSFRAASTVVAALDTASLAEGREINRNLVREILDKQPGAD